MEFPKKHLRIVQKGFENYTGPIHMYDFVDGVSTEPMSRNERDRISACFQCTEIAENGKEKSAGVASRLVSDTLERAPKVEALDRQSDDDKAAEDEDVKNRVGENVEILTEDELDKIIDEGGINALREIADKWNVKDRSIPVLRQKVLDAQESFQSKRKAQQDRVDALRSGEPVDTDAMDAAIDAAADEDDGDLTDEPKLPKLTPEQEAAASGNMAAAIKEE